MVRGVEEPDPRRGDAVAGEIGGSLISGKSRRRAVAERRRLREDRRQREPGGAPPPPGCLCPRPATLQQHEWWGSLHSVVSRKRNRSI